MLYHFPISNRLSSGRVPPFLSLACRRLLEAKRASLLPHIWSFLITFPHSLNKILSLETCEFSCIRIASLFLSRTHRQARCSYIIKMQNTLFLSQCFQKQCFQSQHFLKPVLPVSSLEKKVYEADFCKAWCSSQSIVCNCCYIFLAFTVPCPRCSLCTTSCHS